MRDYQYVKINIDKINPYEKNARTHSNKQLEQIMNSIKAYGFTNPMPKGWQFFAKQSIYV